MHIFACPLVKLKKTFVLFLWGYLITIAKKTFAFSVIFLLLIKNHYCPGKIEKILATKSPRLQITPNE